MTQYRGTRTPVKVIETDTVRVIKIDDRLSLTLRVQDLCPSVSATERQEYKLQLLPRAYYIAINLLLKSIQSLCSIPHVRCFRTLWECKCICSMPNVCCAGHYWFVHKLDNDNYFLFSSKEGLKGQLSIFTTQALLELPKVARSSHVYLFYPWTEPSSRNSAQLLFSSHCNLCSPVYCWFVSN